MPDDLTHAKSKKTLQEDGSIKVEDPTVVKVLDHEAEETSKVDTEQDKKVDQAIEEAGTEKKDQEQKEPKEPDLASQIQELKDQYDRLSFENKTLKEALEGKGTEPVKARTWEDLSVDELKVYRRQFRANDEHEKADEINDLILKKTQFQAESQAKEQVTFQQKRAESWQQTVEDISKEAQELNDPDFDIGNRQSAIFKLADKIYRENPQLAAFPEGESYAAKEAARILGTEKLRKLNATAKDSKRVLVKEQQKTALEGAGRAGDVAPSLQRMMDEASNFPTGTPMWEQKWRQITKELAKQNR
jgi:hypothetical protein